MDFYAGYVRSNKPPTPYSNHLVPGWQVQASDGKKSKATTLEVRFEMCPW